MSATSDRAARQPVDRARRGTGCADRRPRLVGRRARAGSAGSVYGAALLLAHHRAAPTASARSCRPYTDWTSLLFYPIGIFMLLAIGLNIVVGQAGLLDLGFVAFFAIGAYTMAYLGTELRLALLADRWSSASFLAALSGRHPRRADAAAARRLPGDRHARLR